MWCNRLKFANTTYTRMEAKNMKSNMIWDKVAGFMQQLRCENLSQKTMVQMPEQKKAKS